jgi:hypothetical protein
MEFSSFARNKSYPCKIKLQMVCLLRAKEEELQVRRTRHDCSVRSLKAPPQCAQHIRSRRWEYTLQVCKSWQAVISSTIKQLAIPRDNFPADVNPITPTMPLCGILTHEKSHAWMRKGYFSSKLFVILQLPLVKGVHLIDPLKGQSSSCKIDVCNKNGWPCSVFDIFVITQFNLKRPGSPICGI